MLLLTILSLLWLTTLQAQEFPSAGEFPQGEKLTATDSLFLLHLPELTLPSEKRSRELPAIVDNSTLPYLRPVFEQVGPSCGQACLVGYNFTYEINRARDLSANVPENQYATHFSYNFMNGGNGWYGVSYFHSMEVLRLCGNMNVTDYGGTYYDDGKRWINGYDLYYRAMFNRINGAYSINTTTEEGLQTLKQWLYDHHEGSPYGGVASFYANSPYNARKLDDATPEGGKYVITNWYPDATHAMTIVGYNDSIRWDYNGDGIYTNDMDINEDGVLDVKDWEIGGVKFVNSYGSSNLNSGFCYMMYKVLAETFENGGIWNQSVHVLEINDDYQPKLTFKVALKHNYREKIRVRAGISADTAAGLPEHIMDFPIFNFQGANHYMQGYDTEEDFKTVEFGLDVTPLLSYAQPGIQARFFLLVDEKDPNNEGSGELVAFSLMDYTSAEQEVPCTETPIPLNENDFTLVSVVYAADIQKPEITTTHLPPFSSGTAYSQQLNATGGTPPYRWDLFRQYAVQADTSSYIPIDQVQLFPSPANRALAPVVLDFDFPYFGKKHDTIFLNSRGFLQFTPDQLPWPYLEDNLLHLKNNRIIAPLANQDFMFNTEQDDGAWYEGNSSYATFRWKLSWEGAANSTEYDFSVTLYPSGIIEFNFGTVTPAAFNWASGISEGMNISYYLSPPHDLAGFGKDLLVRFRPSPFPTGMSVTRDGVLTGTPEEDDMIYDLLFKVTDDNNISSSRQIPFTTGPVIDYMVTGENDEAIDYGDTVTVDAVIRNTGVTALAATGLVLELEDDFTEVLKASAYVGNIPAGGSVSLTGCFRFVVSEEAPDQHPIWMQTTLNTGSGSWHKELSGKVNAPQVRIWKWEVLDGNNGILETGETAEVELTLINEGHSDMTSVTGELTVIDRIVEITSGDQPEFGDLIRGHMVKAKVTIHALDAIPSGTEARIALRTDCDQQISRLDTFALQIGKKPVLVIDLDPGFHTGPEISGIFQDIGVISDYSTHIPGNLKNYQALFVCLGYWDSSHELTWQEGNLLSSYLNDGGRIYMEGKNTWRDDVHTPVHDMFNIASSTPPTEYEYISGADSTFTEEMVFENSALHPFNFYRIEPVAPAFSILRDSVSKSSCAIAYDQGTYRTIGTIFELGKLRDDEYPSTKQELLLRFLDFFGISYSLTSVREISPVSANIPVVLFPNPFAENVTFNVDFHEPVTSFRLVIHDLNGRTVRTLVNKTRIPAGSHEFSWDGTNDGGMKVGSGIYVYRIIAGERTARGKIIFLK
jgi:hypothetical protein